MNKIGLVFLFAIIVETICISGTGDATWFTGALGSCGKSLTGDYVAMNGAQYSSSLCGTCIKIRGTKATVVGKILDKCPGCSSGSIDVAKNTFIKLFGDAGIGRVHNVHWESCSC